jgi:hypothetical protein
MNAFDEEAQIASQEDSELVYMLAQSGCSIEETRAFCARGAQFIIEDQRTKRVVPN